MRQFTGTNEPSDREERPERGAGIVEYALLVALIAMVCLAAIQVFGVTNGGSVRKAADSIASAS